MASAWVAFSVTVCVCASPLVASEIAIRIERADLKPRQPQLAVGADRTVHLVFGSEKEIYYCGSKDEGATFSKPVKVAGPLSLALGMRRGPRIAAIADSIIVTAIGGEKGGGQDGDVLAWESTDEGRTWNGPLRVNDVDASAREGLHAMAAGPGHDLYCVWLDLRNKQTEIMGAKSNDSGRTWGRNHLVYQSPDGSVCECCHPSVNYADDGSLYVMWRNSLGGNRDMYWAMSRDDGVSFSKAAKLGVGSWKLKACPMDGGAVAARNSSEVYSVWRRDKTVYLTRGSSRPEEELGEGEQPWLTLTKRGPMPVWVNRRGGDLLLKLPNERTAMKLASIARDPVCVASGSAAFVAWESDHEGVPAVFVRRIDLDDQLRVRGD